MDVYGGNTERLAEALRERAGMTPEIALTLGTGLGALAEEVEGAVRIDYSELPGFPVPTAPGHDGKFIFGTLGGKKVAVMKGRLHYYEGYSVRDTVLPLRLLGMTGARVAILTNAVGAVNVSFRPGDFVAVRDHISTFMPSPLTGQNDDGLGPRFPDMSEVYDPDMIGKALQIGTENNIRVREGIYVQLPGPQYETPAEIRMLRALGADTVGMSTAVEAIAAVHMGMRVCAIGCVTNMGAGICGGKLGHDSVTAAAVETSDKFSILISELIRRI